MPVVWYTSELAQELNERLDETWSPEQIAAKRRAEGKPFVCFKTIYRWLYDGRLAAGEVRVLRHKGKRRKPVETRGHWKLDTVVSSRGKSKACAATFIERKTRLYVAMTIPDRTAASMEAAFHAVASRYPSGTFQTATTDSGKEFACYERLKSRHGVCVYFVDPYSCWQRGSNENANGLLREFFPKGHDFSTVMGAQLTEALRRKSLGWKSAHEDFMDGVSHLARQSVNIIHPSTDILRKLIRPQPQCGRSPGSLLSARRTSLDMISATSGRTGTRTAFALTYTVFNIATIDRKH